MERKCSGNDLPTGLFQCAAIGVHIKDHYTFRILTDSRDGGHDFAKLELVQNGSLDMVEIGRKESAKKKIKQNGHTNVVSGVESPKGENNLGSSHPSSFIVIHSTSIGRSS